MRAVRPTKLKRRSCPWFSGKHLPLLLQGRRTDATHVVLPSKVVMDDTSGTAAQSCTNFRALPCCQRFMSSPSTQRFAVTSAHIDELRVSRIVRYFHQNVELTKNPSTNHGLMELFNVWPPFRISRGRAHLRRSCAGLSSSSWPLRTTYPEKANFVSVAR